VSRKDDRFITKTRINGLNLEFTAKLPAIKNRFLHLPFTVYRLPLKPVYE